MRKIVFILFLLITCGYTTTALAFTPKTNPKDTTRKIRVFSISGGLFKTSLNFFKNIDQDPYSAGYSLRALLQTSETFRLSGTFCKVASVNIDPTWVNVRNSFFDLDANFMMHFADARNLAYFIAGASGQYWNGYYTGLRDLNTVKPNAAPNMRNQGLHISARTGMGAEIKIYGPISGYGEFIFRFSGTDRNKGLIDLSYNTGIKVNVANLARRRHHSILHFRDKYHWF